MTDVYQRIVALDTTIKASLVASNISPASETVYDEQTQTLTVSFLWLPDATLSIRYAEDSDLVVWELKKGVDVLDTGAYSGTAPTNEAVGATMSHLTLMNMNRG